MCYFFSNICNTLGLKTNKQHRKRETLVRMLITATTSKRGLVTFIGIIQILLYCCSIFVYGRQRTSYHVLDRQILVSTVHDRLYYFTYPSTVPFVVTIFDLACNSLDYVCKKYLSADPPFL
jgi:hypothetical protein